MPIAEFEKKLNSLSYEYRLTIFNMLDYFYEKQKNESVPDLQDAKTAFNKLCNEAQNYRELSLDEINEEIQAIS